MEINALSLNIKEKTLGSLVTNAKELQECVYDRLKDYSAETYNGDAKKAKEDKALLNKVAEQFDEKRKALKKEWDEPFSEFEQIMTETSNKIKEVSGSLKRIVDEKEAKEKAAKKAEIEDLWKSKDFNLTSLDKIFNSKWLNKTYKIAAISSDMDLIIKNVNNDLAALDAFGEDTSTLKEFYLTTLDLQKTLTRGAEMKANREKLAEEKARVEAAKTQEVTEAETTVEVPAAKVETPAPKVEEVKKELPKICSTKEYPFVVTGESIEKIAEMAKGLGIKIIPSIAMLGNVADIEAFKALLSENGLVYSKQAVTHLIVSHKE